MTTGSVLMRAGGSCATVEHEIGQSAAKSGPRFAPRENLVTPSLLKRAKACESVKVKDYPSMTIDVRAAAVALGELGESWTQQFLEAVQRRKKVYNNALELVGGTPMVRLDRIAAHYGLECELWAKCEFLSIGGSVKDRIAKAMVEVAEAEGRLTAGNSAIVEATSGNTGVGLSLVAAVKNYRALIVMPEKMSQEKLNTMRALGAEIIRTPSDAAWNDMQSHIGLAEQLQITVENCHFLDQYINAANPVSHYLGTAEEILFQTDAKMDMMIMTAGTGGTATGIAAKLKEKLPNCVIVAVDPEGSTLAQPADLNAKNLGVAYQVEGIGYDFIPSTLSRHYIDEWIKCNDKDTFAAARELTRLEGLLVGGSSGAALFGAAQAARRLKRGQRAVVLLPDSARNYMSKHYSDDWMEDHGFMARSNVEPVFLPQKFVSDLPLQGKMPAVCLTPKLNLSEALTRMQSQNHAVVVSSSADGEAELVNSSSGSQQHLIGLVSKRALLIALSSGQISLTESAIAPFVDRKFGIVDSQTSLDTVARKLRQHDALILPIGRDENNRVAAQQQYLLLDASDLCSAAAAIASPF